MKGRRITLAQSKANDALFDAAMNGKVRDVKAALKAGADVNTWDEDGLTVLMYAARNNGNSRVVRALIDAGADKSAKSSDGRRAIDLLEVRSDESEFSKTASYQQMCDLLDVLTEEDLL